MLLHRRSVLLIGAVYYGAIFSNVSGITQLISDNKSFLLFYLGNNEYSWNFAK